MDRIADWWDGLELWIAGLPFIPQVVLVLAVVLPLCWLIAVSLDRGLSAVLSLPIFGWPRRNSRERPSVNAENSLREVEEN